MTETRPTVDQIAVLIDFENIAQHAKETGVKFKLAALMEYLRTRGSVVIKRAYSDFGRFSEYRSGLMENAIDMIHTYGIRAGKNRADIQMAIDALEMVMSRPNISTFVIVSGDSDFGPLVSKLREYGKYTLGIGPRKITHDLLVKSNDEFIYLETVMGEMMQDDEEKKIDRVAARVLLRKALSAHGQRGDLPLLASKLKQTMLSLNPAFNEADFGHSQFKSWLEDHDDLVKMFFQGMQLYVAPPDFKINGKEKSEAAPTSAPAAAPAAETSRSPYEKAFNHHNLLTVECEGRRLILGDIYTELSEHPAERTTDELLDYLVTSYEKTAHTHTKTTVRQIWQMAFRQFSFDYSGKPVSVHVPVKLLDEITSKEQFLRRAESSFIFAVVNDNLAMDKAEIAEWVCGDREDTDYVQTLIDSLVRRKKIMLQDGKYVRFKPSKIPFRDDENLAIIWEDIRTAEPKTGRHGMQKSIKYFHNSGKRHQRKKAYGKAAHSFLNAAALQTTYLEKYAHEKEHLDELLVYITSYASAKAGELLLEDNNLYNARNYYLVFFYLAQPGKPPYEQFERLIPPLLSYYWMTAPQELEIDTNDWDVRNATPAEIALRCATNRNRDLRRTWQDITKNLHTVNPTLVREVTSQMKILMAEEKAAENKETA